MEVTLIEKMGTDLSVVNAARVSYDAVHTTLTDGDKRLIHFLAEHEHVSPFFHPQVSLRITAPIYVANQLKRHQVGAALNEVSRRYVDTPPRFEFPNEWRKRPEKGQNKQGSGGLIDDQQSVTDVVCTLANTIQSVYQWMLDKGVAPEQIRTLLPMSTQTTWIWTGSLAFFVRVCRMRLQHDVQRETREVAQAIADIVEPLFPVAWAKLIERGE